MADLKFDVDYSDLSRSLDALMEMGKASKNTATAFEQSFRQIKRWQDTFKGQQGKINAQLEATHQKLQLANKSAKSSAQAFIAHEKAIQDNTNALNRMKMSYDANYAVEQRTLQLKKLLRQEIANGNMTVREAGAELLRYRQNLISFNQVQMAATKSSNRMGVVTQQAGYQVSDFIVQVQSGTNPFVAFSQQASQLAGVLPLVAGNLGLTTTAAIGLSAALGIGIPLVGALGAAWLVSKKSQEDFTASLPPLKQALKGVREETKELAAEIAILQGNFETASEAALENAIATMKAERSGLGPRTGKFATLGADIKEAERALKLLRDRRDFLEQESQYYNDILGSTEGLKQANQALNDIFESRLGTIDDTANNYEDILGSSKGLAEAEQALNDIFESRLGTIDDTANKYEDVLGTAEGLQSALTALLELEEARKNAIIEGLFGGLDKQVERANEFYDVAITGQEELNDLASELGTRLGTSFAEGLEIIRQAKAEASVGLDAFGGSGEFKYSTSSTYKPPAKTKTTGGGRSTKEILANLQKQINLEKYLVDASDARKRVVQAVGETYARNNPQIIEGLTEQVQAIKDIEAQEARRIKTLEEAAQKQKEMQDFISQSFESGFMSIIDGTQSVKDAFRSMARDIIAELYRVLVVKKLVSAATGYLGFADGGVFQGGSQVQAFADGGVVGGPTFFPMSGGKTGLMGEAGPEAIMPLKRGKDGKLGVEAQGGGSITVNQTINVSTGVQQTVRTEIKSLMPQIAESAKAAVADAKRRGGSYGKAF